LASAAAGNRDHLPLAPKPPQSANFHDVMFMCRRLFGVETGKQYRNHLPRAVFMRR
jgi:hypothetical protein